MNDNRPINPEDLSVSCLVLSNSGNNFAIYARDPDGNIEGRLFITKSELQDLFTAFNKIINDQHLDTTPVTPTSIPDVTENQTVEENQ